MLIDGITLAALKGELEKSVVGTRISRIYQPEGDEVVFLLSTRERLLFSASGERCRVNLTRLQKANPDKAPNFCMLLRKYILNGRIMAVEQESLERILSFKIEAKDELGNPSLFTLVCEMMGRHSNLILVAENGLILDSIKRIPPDVSSIRQVLPGVRYKLPPLGKENILTLEAEEAAAVLEKSIANGLSMSKALVNSFAGLYPAAAREILKNIDENDPLSAKKAAEAAKNFVEKSIYSPEPCIDSDENDFPVYFSSLPLDERRLAKRTAYESVNDCVDAYYSLRDTARILERERSWQQQIIKKNLTNVEKKLKTQYDILISAEDAEEIRIKGELLTANLYNIKRGAAQAEVYNYYTDAMIKIPLDPKFAPSVNAQRYYKRYGKLKTAEGLAEDMITKLEAERDYLDALSYDLSSAKTLEDAHDIRAVLTRQGYITENKKEKVKRRDPLSSPMRFRSSDGFLILAGRNSRQNDALTMRAASGSDIWLHSKNIPGSHVIIFTEGKTVSADAIAEACNIAACNSKGAASGRVDIDYTERKNVWKPNGAKPGMVLFEHNKTLSIRPDREAMEKLRIKEDE
ncbi:MAG: NFACT family protein [Christensenellaceae bacterium]|nr:NFACT family protein [Christensenellaceae bacterium]